VAVRWKKTVKRISAMVCLAGKCGETTTGERGLDLF
jgi:hypothetical protein